MNILRIVIINEINAKTIANNLSYSKSLEIE